MGDAFCKECGKAIIWLKTKKGKNMPVDAETVVEGDKIFDNGCHRSHFDTCPAADLFRKKKTEEKKPDPDPGF